jgi:arylsulfatase A-like enzyme
MKDKAVIDATIDAIKSADEPFFYFTHLNDVHVDYEPVAPFYQSFEKHSLFKRYKNLRYQRHIHWNQSDIYANRMEIDKDQVPITEDLYRGCIKQADANIKRLVAALKKAGIYENTILVLFGDHGDQLGWNNMMSHQFSVCDELLRVPMVIQDPTGKLNPGRHTEIVQLNDLYPTVLFFADIDPPSTFSIDLTKESGRESAYVYYRASNDFLSRMKNETGLSLDAFPPAIQYAIWESPERKTI